MTQLRSRHEKVVIRYARPHPCPLLHPPSPRLRRDGGRVKSSAALLERGGRDLPDTRPQTQNRPPAIPSPEGEGQDEGAPNLLANNFVFDFPQTYGILNPCGAHAPCSLKIWKTRRRKAFRRRLALARQDGAASGRNDSGTGLAVWGAQAPSPASGWRLANHIRPLTFSQPTLKPERQNQPARAPVGGTRRRVRSPNPTAKFRLIPVNTA